MFPSLGQIALNHCRCWQVWQSNSTSYGAWRGDLAGQGFAQSSGHCPMSVRIVRLFYVPGPGVLLPTTLA